MQQQFTDDIFIYLVRITILPCSIRKCSKGNTAGVHNFSSTAGHKTLYKCTTAATSSGHLYEFTVLDLSHVYLCVKSSYVERIFVSLSKLLNAKSFQCRTKKIPAHIKKTKKRSAYEFLLYVTCKQGFTI